MRPGRIWSERLGRLLLVNVLAAAVALSTGIASAAAGGGAAQEAVVGVWSGGDSLMRVSVQDGRLSMTILALRDAVYLPDEEVGEAGAPRRDDNNPEPDLRDRPLIGMELLQGYRWTGKRWEGKVYDPASGNTYSSRMERDGNRLKMRGYVGVPMFGRTQFFDRVGHCDAAVAQMLAVSNAELAFCD